MRPNDWPMFVRSNSATWELEYAIALLGGPDRIMAALDEARMLAEAPEAFRRAPAALVNPHYRHTVVSANGKPPGQHPTRGRVGGVGQSRFESGRDHQRGYSRTSNARANS